MFSVFFSTSYALHQVDLRRGMVSGSGLGPWGAFRVLSVPDSEKGSSSLGHEAAATPGGESVVLTLGLSTPLTEHSMGMAAADSGGEDTMMHLEWRPDGGTGKKRPELLSAQGPFVKLSAGGGRRARACVEARALAMDLWAAVIQQVKRPERLPKKFCTRGCR